MKNILLSPKTIFFLHFFYLISIHGWGQFKVIGYLPNYQWWISDPSNSDAAKYNSSYFSNYTQINLAFANPQLNDNGTATSALDAAGNYKWEFREITEYKDEKGKIHPVPAKTDSEVKTMLTNLNKKFLNKKYYISIGGAGSGKTQDEQIGCFYEAYQALMITSTKRTKLVYGLLSFLKNYESYGVIGIDIDLEYRAVMDKNYSEFVKLLSTAIATENLLRIASKKVPFELSLTAEMKNMWKNYSKALTYYSYNSINIMSYDYPTTNKSPNHAPYWEFKDDFGKTKGNKNIVMGLPFYGKYIGDGNEIAYKDILCTSQNGTVANLKEISEWDDHDLKICGKTDVSHPYYNGKNTIATKVKWLQEPGQKDKCIGVFIWAIGNDEADSKYSLLKIIKDGLFTVIKPLKSKPNISPRVLVSNNSTSNARLNILNTAINSFFVEIENNTTQTFNGTLSLGWKNLKTGLEVSLIPTKTVTLPPNAIEYLDRGTSPITDPAGFYELRVYANGLLIDSDTYEIVSEITGGESASDCNTTQGVQMTISRPNEMDFNEISLGSFGDEYLRISNPSTGILQGSLEIAPNHPAFEIQSLTNSFYLQPGEFQDFYVRYTPTAYGSVSVPIYINHNATNYGCNYGVNMTAQTTAPPIQINEKLDCSEAVALNCGITYNGTTSGAVNKVSHYGENGEYFPISEDGPEKVHTFTAGSTGISNFVFNETATGNLDLYVLSSCGDMQHTLAHVGGGIDIRGSFDVTAGQTYYFVVDGENGASGDYSLKIECPAGSSSGGGGGISCATINKSSIDFGFIGSGSYGQQYFTINNPTNQYTQGWVKFEGQHGNYFGIWVPNVGYLTEYYYSLNPNESITLEVMVNASINANFSAQAKITFEGSCTSSPYYIALKAINIPTINWLTQFDRKSFDLCYSPNNTIQWTSNALNPYSDAAIEYSLDGGLNWLPYFYSPPNNICGGGSGSNCVANDGEDSFNSMGQYTRFGKIRIRYDCYDTNLPWIISDGFFTVKDPLNNTVNITYPNIQEVLTCGQTINITWQQEDTYSNGYRLYYSIDGGNTWILIGITTGGNAYTSHSYAWQVPNISTTQLKFKVEDIDGATWGLDLSDYFNIIKCTTVPSIQVSESIIKPSCANATNGSVSLNISGGTGGYLCTWKKASLTVGTRTTLTNINAGDYTYFITDNSGNSTTGTVSVSSINFNIIPSFTQATCSKSDGSASVSVSPSGVYSFLWSDQSTNASISAKKSGLYSVIVTQTNTGCSQMESIYIPSSSSPIDLSINGNTEVCQGATSILTANPTGGLAPYKFNWSNNQTTQNVTIGAGAYLCLVTDANNCTAIKSLLITEKTVPSIPNITSTTINNGQTATLAATSCLGTINWYNVPTGSSSLGNGSSFTTPSLNSTTIYYADCTIDNCVSASRGSGTVTVNAVSCPISTGMQWQNTFPTSFQPYWKGIAGNSYVVRYRVSGTINWTETALIPCTQDGIVVTTLSGLNNGQTYEWQVKTVCSPTNSSNYSTSTFSATYCRSATIITPSGTNLTATTANIQWNSTPSNVNLRFRVAGTTLWDIANNLTTSQTWLTNLLPGTNYEAQIQTVCTDGILSAFTPSIYFTTLSCPSSLVLGVGYFATGIYKIGQTISSKASINTGTIYNAGKSILLLPGFYAAKGVNFEAQTKGCN